MCLVSNYLQLVMNNRKFWENIPISELTNSEWEALCDGCGKCCPYKLEDEEDNQVYYTDIVCNLLDMDSCQCSDYHNRHINVPDCISFGADDVKDMHWLPDTCAYRLRYLGQPLYDWHYLISGSKETIHKEQESVKDFAIVDCGQNLDEHIIYFKP